MDKFSLEQVRSFVQDFAKWRGRVSGLHVVMDPDLCEWAIENTPELFEHPVCLDDAVEGNIIWFSEDTPSSWEVQ